MQQQSPSLQFYTLHFTFNVLITRFLKDKATFSFPLRKKETKCLLPFSVTDMKTWFALRTHSQSLSETNSRSMDFYNVYYDINKYLQIPAFKSLFRHWHGFYSRKERKHYKKYTSGPTIWFTTVKFAKARKQSKDRWQQNSVKAQKN